MTLYRFLVHMHRHAPGDVVDVHPDDVASLVPLVQAGLIEEVYPAFVEPVVPSRHKRSLAGSVTVTREVPPVESGTLDADPGDVT